MLKNLKKFLNQKGQALLMYGFLVPILFIAGGAGVEIGWYYMNVSRLQNAADAAVIAAFKKLSKHQRRRRRFRI